jgi:hypothetical protein
MFLYDRTPNGASEWTERGRNISYRLEDAIRQIMEDEYSEEPFCLRDFENIVYSATTNVCLGEQLRLRFQNSKKEQ